MNELMERIAFYEEVYSKSTGHKAAYMLGRIERAYEELLAMEQRFLDRQKESHHYHDGVLCLGGPRCPRL